MDLAKCRGCKAPIYWAISPKGKKIPLDVRAPVYREDPGRPGHLIEGEDHYVSHFATCPKASQFSGRSRKELYDDS